MATLTPPLLIERHLETVLGHLSGVFDGDVESVHQARISTRRLREVLPLAKELDDSRAAATLRAAGRHLGRVRELDVMRDLLDVARSRLSAGSAAAAAHAARRTLRERQAEQRRAMVEALEQLDLAALRDVLAAHHKRPGWLRVPAALGRRSEWVDRLWARIASRSAGAAEAVGRASGVYFPKRSHRARVAVKKLRYAVEVAADTGVWTLPRLLKDLRRVQATLGELHDAQELYDALPALVPDGGVGDIAPLRDMLDDDIARHHAEYMRRRDRVFVIAEVCELASRTGVQRPSRAPLIAMCVVAPLLVLGRSRNRTAGDHALEGHAPKDAPATSA